MGGQFGPVPRPVYKIGRFSCEITSRLTIGLAEDIPDLQTRVDHILKNQVFGIAITHLTSLLARRSVYCSKHAKGIPSIAKSFDSDAGNVWFERLEHPWKDGRCAYCRARQEIFDRGEDRESHAYVFIHTDAIQTRLAECFGGNMHFDVIIGNPPYQMKGGAGVVKRDPNRKGVLTSFRGIAETERFKPVETGW